MNLSFYYWLGLVQSAIVVENATLTDNLVVKYYGKGDFVKRFRQVFGLALLIITVFLFLYGIGDLEKAEEVRLQRKILNKYFKNSDAYAWIRVEGTKINYPVLQHPTDDAYYLTHDAEGNETQYGAIFTERVNQTSFEDSVTIIYGHAMRDDSMFGSLDYLAEPSTFESIQTVTITKDGKDFLYQIVAKIFLY